MSRKKESGSRVDPALKKAIHTLVSGINAKGDDGKPLYSLTDKCKIFDRALKLAAIEAKMEDAGFGSGFSDQAEE